MSRKPKFHFVTLFPDCIAVWLKSSILGRAFEKGLFDFSLVQLRDFANNKHSSVDDLAYGGGGGMVLKVEPLENAVKSILETVERSKTQIIYFSPSGEKLDQRMISRIETSDKTDFILICGHYEGVDQRFIDRWVDLEVSIGDFVITGGELPAVIFADAMIRGLSGALGAEDGHKRESFQLESDGKRLLEYPHFTRPADYQGLRVPEVLLSGDHAAIESWRMEEAIKRTRARRPDLLS